MTDHLIIVGAGMATAYLLQELASHPHRLNITVIGDEPEVCYNRVMLSGVLSGESAENDLQMLGEANLKQAVTFVTGTRVSSVDLQACEVHTDKGDRLHYDQLVFATGATVARPALAATQASGVEEMRTLADARRLRYLSASGGRALVVGGGLLGLEAAHGLNVLGFETTVLHRRAHLMNRQLDAEGGRLLRRKMEYSGIRFCLDTSVSALTTANNRLAAVTLHSGEQLPCELLVFATGIDPDASLARAAGIATERGVLVDEYMRTSEQRCFALGECSQLGQRCFGLVAPIRAQAQVLARELLGLLGTGFVMEDWPTQLKIAGIEIFSAGEPHAAGEELLLRDDAAGIYRRLVIRDGRLVGVVLVGDKREGTWYRELIHGATDISQYRPGLMFGREVSEALQLAAVAA